jgi:hypothetical protein
MRQEIKSEINDLINKTDKLRVDCMRELYRVLSTNLPVGFEPCIGYGMVSFSVPHALYPSGYHCDPKQPLPFISFAAKKGHIALHHMGLYAQDESGGNSVLQWFVDAWPSYSSKKLDMGKGCIRFKHPTDIPFDLIAELAQKITVEQWISAYEKAFRSAKK